MGAALLDQDGRIFPGANVENASFGLTTCAERSAITRAVTDGARSLIALAITGPSDTEALMPCGSCRQILFEHAPDLILVVPNESGYRVLELQDLLPDAFGAESLRHRLR